jgi:hypothetical protein
MDHIAKMSECFEQSRPHEKARTQANAIFERETTEQERKRVMTRIATNDAYVHLFTLTNYDECEMIRKYIKEWEVHHRSDHDDSTGSIWHHCHVSWRNPDK